MASEIPALIEEIKSAKDWRSCNNLNDKWKKTFPELMAKLSDDDWKEIEALLCACIEHGNGKILEAFAYKIMDKRNVVNWKKHHEIIDKMIDCILKYGTVDDDDKSFHDIGEKLLKVIKTNRLMKDKKEKLLAIIEASLSHPALESPIHQAFVGMAGDFPWKELSHEQSVDLMKGVAQCVYANPTMSESERKYTACWLVLIRIFQEGTMPLFLKLGPTVAEIFNFCKDQEWIDENDSDQFTISYHFLKEIMEDFLNRHNSQTELLKPCMETIKELWQCGDDILERDANYIMTAVASNIELAGDQTDELLDRYFSGQDPSLIAQFTSLYPKAPEKFFQRFDELIQSMKGAEEWVQLSIQNILWQMAKDRAEAFGPDAIEAVVNGLSGDNTVHLAFQILTPLAEKLPADVMFYDDQIMKAIKRLKSMGTGGMGVLVALSKRSEDKARLYMQFIADTMPIVETIYKTALLYNMRSIGLAWRDVLAEQRPLLEQLRKDSALEEHVRGCIDIIEGRSLEGVAADLTDTKKDVDAIEERVEATEENVENLGRQVDQNTDNINEVKATVIEHEEKIGDLKETVEDTVVKVEELEHKTLSHAPRWSRDVAEILNPVADIDWRLLASRLGYTNDDIRNWATQPNPCLSMFDEWFATHKTREATFAVLKQLQEMNQMQAAMIVENALKSVEEVVEDEEVDYVDPPEVFISYQWGHQEEVKLLKRHLEMAGFNAWMDIGQMGGGDKLFQKIDEGIRAAKIIICCVSEKYAKSPNCNREVNLSVNLGKPIIPLLMEQIQWPPPGAMGPIFGEYLFIRFFQRPSEASGDDRYWPIPKFQELLMQIRYHVVPEADKITEEYKSWMEPPEEIIVIKPREQKSIAVDSSKNTTDEPLDSPEIFISYQWGKQPQIKALFKKLVSMGFTCWFDIMQMGGGDSLYDKIDKGIRGCKVVLTCVTSKYSFSANCRREVSLADALKKPVIPLLLEKIPWPPEGPMSMVFTQLLYIDFCSPDAEIQNHWNVPQFDELIGKIYHHLPSGPEKPQIDNQETVVKEQIVDNESTVNTQSDTKTYTVPVEDLVAEIESEDETGKAEITQTGNEKEMEENIPISPKQNISVSEDKAGKEELENNTVSAAPIGSSPSKTTLQIEPTQGSSCCALL